MLWGPPGAPPASVISIWLPVHRGRVTDTEAFLGFGSPHPRLPHVALRATIQLTERLRPMRAATGIAPIIAIDPGPELPWGGKGKDAGKFIKAQRVA